jgi:general secretion pathway protein K
MRRSATTDAGERGMILVVVLWAVAIISFVLVAVNFTAQSEVFVARNSIAIARARHAAEGGIQIGLARLLARQADPNAAFDGTPEPADIAGTPVGIAITDEAGKIDINVAPMELLVGLFKAIGRPPAEATLLACQIVNHRGDSDPACGPASTERRPHPLFSSTGELAFLPGFDPATYAAVADYVTVRTRATAIDPRAASRTVLLAIPGATASVVDTYLGQRAAFRDLGPDTIEEALVASPALMLSQRHDFTIRAHAVAGAAQYTVDMEVRLTPGAERPFTIVAWHTPTGSGTTESSR